MCRQLACLRLTVLLSALSVFSAANHLHAHPVPKRSHDRTIVVRLTPNEVVVVPQDEIDERQKSSVSMMPEGLLDKLSKDEVRDLIGYLGSPVQVPLPAGSPPRER